MFEDDVPASLLARFGVLFGLIGPALITPCPSVLLINNVFAVVGLGHTFLATAVNTLSAAGREMSRSSTKSKELRVNTSSAVRKLWPSSFDNVSTLRPATRASERCFAAIAEGAPDQSTRPPRDLNCRPADRNLVVVARFRETTNFIVGRAKM